MQSQHSADDPTDPPQREREGAREKRGESAPFLHTVRARGQDARDENEARRPCWAASGSGLAGCGAPSAGRSQNSSNREKNTTNQTCVFQHCLIFPDLQFRAFLDVPLISPTQAAFLERSAVSAGIDGSGG